MHTGFDHGAGHPLLFLDDAKAPNCQKNNGFSDLGNYSEWPKVAGAVIQAEVQYQLHVNDSCQIVSDKPVGAFWHLREVSSEKTEPLSDLEHMAYGVTNQQVAENRVSFDLGVLEHFRALEQRRITATVRYDPSTATCTPSVQTAINGQVAALERIYVQAEERLVRPKVMYIDVYGKSLASRPTPVKERIDP